MLNKYFAILSLNENEDNIKSLTKTRPLASIPVGGRYRIIDFILSNLVNSDISNVGILTQSKSRSLMDHLGTGKSWDLDRKLKGLFIFNFESRNSHLSDIEMLEDNLEYLYRSQQEYVLLASSKMVCNINFEEVAKFYEDSGSDVTIVYKNVNDGCSNFLDCNVLNINKDGKVLSAGRNIGSEDSINVSMGMCIMKSEMLINIINECVQTGYYTSIRNWIYKHTETLNVNAFEFSGYLQCVNSISTYYKLNMDMLNPDVNKDLFFKNGLIFTKVKDEAPTMYYEGSSVHNSLIANGCLIEGSIENSVLARRITVGAGAVIKDCIILQNCNIKENVVLQNVIIDKNNIIEANKEFKGDKEHPLVIEKTRFIYKYESKV